MHQLFLISIALIVFACGSSKKTHIQKTPEIKSKQKTIITNAGPTKAFESAAFSDATEEVGLLGVQAKRLYAVDLDKDGLDDLVVLPEFYSSPVFYLNDNGRFKRSKSHFFDPPVKASALIFDDFDRDGELDVLVYVHNQKTELTKRPIRVFSGTKYRGTTFYKLDPRFDFKSKLPVTSVSTVDYDFDGNLDFYVGTWFDLNKGADQKAEHDRLFTYKNKRIYDVTAALTGEQDLRSDVRVNATPTYSVSHCDVNGDGYIDFLTSSTAGMPNKMWISKRQGKVFTFTDHAKEARYDQDKDGSNLPRGGGNTTYSICNDYNNDGIMDIAMGEISHSYDPETRDRSSILTGEGLGFPPTFIRTEYTSDNGDSNWNQGDQRASWADFNNDGLVDLLVENTGFPPTSRLILFEQEANHAYWDAAKDRGVDILNPSGSIYMDYDGDGDLDILVGQTNVRDKSIRPRLFVFKNNRNKIGESISLFLKGKKSNLSAVGTKVIVRTRNGLEVSRWHQPSYGAFSSQNSSFLHFGTNGEDIYEIEVHWPTLKNGRRLTKTYKAPFKYFRYHIVLEE